MLVDGATIATIAKQRQYNGGEPQSPFKSPHRRAISCKINLSPLGETSEYTDSSLQFAFETADR